MDKKRKDNNKVPNWILKARNKWTYYGQKRPPFAEEPRADQRSVWDFPRPPALETSPKLVEVLWNDIVLARSTNALELLETASPPTYYVPPKDVQVAKLVKIPGKQSLCEWKGKADYWALIDEPMQPVAWSYPKPFEEYHQLKGYFALYPQHVNCYLDGEGVIPQPGSFYAGWVTRDLAGPFKGEPGSGHW